MKVQFLSALDCSEQTIAIEILVQINMGASSRIKHMRIVLLEPQGAPFCTPWLTQCQHKQLATSSHQSCRWPILRPNAGIPLMVPQPAPINGHLAAAHARHSKAAHSNSHVRRALSQLPLCGAWRVFALGLGTCVWLPECIADKHGCAFGGN